MIRSILISVFLLSGCATFEVKTDSTRWDGPRYAPIQKYEWRQVSMSEIKDICKMEVAREGGCVHRLYHAIGGPKCMIYSTLSESEAHHRYAYTNLGVRLESHFVHEKETHCEQGLDHP